MTRRLAPSRRQMAAQQASPPVATRTKTFPAPVAGLVTADSMIAARPNSAQILDNIFPMAQSARVRAGSTVWARLGDPIVSMVAYNVDGGEKLFVATEDSLFDATTSFTIYLLDENDDPLLDGNDDPLSTEDPTAEITGQGGGYYSYVNFATSGGYFLIIVNGIDPMQQFDGTSWAEITAVSTPVAITEVDTDLLSHVNVYRYRLFMVERDSLRVWYLPVNSIGGAAGEINLAGIFGEGGSILCTATWSMDAGDGLDDKFVVISTVGEVAVFQGSNPADADDWSIVGVYKLTRPLGMRCLMKAGGDLLIGTEEGLVPISMSVNKDPAQLSLGSVSQAIEPTWSDEAADRQAFPWEIAKWPRMNMALVTLPTGSTEESDFYCFVVNLETNAWARYTGWDTRCSIVFDDQAYFGTSDGRIMRAEVGGDDDGDPYYPVCVYNWDALDSLGYLKTVVQARATFVTGSTINPNLSASTDYSVSLPSAPNAPTITETPSVWDVGLWDQAVWDASTQRVTYSTRWVSIGRSGYAIAPQWQMTCSGNVQPTAEFVEMTIRYTMGEIVV
jgi:hypothetical protein